LFQTCGQALRAIVGKEWEMAATKQTGDTFTGFVPETLKFLKALGFHQTKLWFDENRDIYVSALKRPMEAYVAELSKACADHDIPLKGEPSRATFRLNRDVRFSKDKKPYKTNAGCVLTRTGLKGSPGVLYTHIDPSGCFFAAGFYRPEPQQLLAIRHAIVKKPAAFVAIEKKLATAGLKLSVEDTLTRNPRDFAAVDERVTGSVRLKSFIARRPLEDDVIVDGRKLLKAATIFARDALPLLNFGWSVIG
jgi:uncharacterized protein (TIGR02453 family)